MEKDNEKYNKYREFLNKLREAIRPQIKEFKLAEFNRNGGCYRDAVTGYKTKTPEIDHDHRYYTFQKLVYDFLKHHKISLSQVDLKNLKETKELFKKWHSEKAVLRILTKARNKFFYYKYQKKNNIPYQEFYKDF
jgi:hypothetical protein